MAQMSPFGQPVRATVTSSNPQLLHLVADSTEPTYPGTGEPGWTLSPTPPSAPLVPPLTGSSTVDLLIYQTLCYTHDELRDVDVGDFVLKPCGLEEFLQK